MSAPHGFEDKVAFVWKVADKLRGNFRPHEYGQVMLPLLVLRRLDCVLEPTKPAVLAKVTELEAAGISNPDRVLKKVAGQKFYNTSPLTLTTVLADDKNVAANLRTYVNGFSPGAVEVLEEYRFDDKITRLDKAGILYQVLGDFVGLDLHPNTVSNEAMGYVFEELLRKFSEMSNETAGEHYTPREVIRLMVALLFAEDAEALSGPAPVRTIYDPAAGTGGMLTVSGTYLHDLNPAIDVQVYGQELNPETWAIARSDLMIKGNDPERMVLGNSLTADGWADRKFDYCIANPPYGVDWKAYADPIKAENAAQEPNGRFNAGLPRISDGSFLFLQHMISKMKPVDDRPETPWIDGGGRIAIVLSGSPLFSGAAESGESNIRRWIIENDWLEGIVALPDQMFYNTGISTYVWILTNDKADEDRGTVKLIDARELGTKMRKSLGDKRKELTPAAIEEVVRLYGGARDEYADDARVKVLTNETFGFQRITVERPMRRRWEVTAKAVADEPYAAYASLVGQRYETEKALLSEVPALTTAQKRAFVKACAVADPEAPIVKGRAGKVEPDPDLRDQENVPLPARWLDLDDEAREKALIETSESHLENEIRPYVADAWIDHSKTKVGFEIPFTRQFYVYTPPRPVEQIAQEIKDLEGQIQHWMNGLDL